MSITSRLSTALADRYKIESHLGEGGMANVYLAHDLKHDRRVAVKVLRPELAAVLGAERFIQEIKTTANLQHPHILPLFDSGEADSFLYYVMPFIDGETLRDKLNRETQLGIEEAVKITTEVADALDYAHRNNVIHRDIKPENILLHDGRPMVADFGIALALSAAAGGRMTETGLSLGTPHYMSPEQATAEKNLTNRSDIYSLGAVLYEMLTGDPPHRGSSAQQIIMKILTDEARPVMELRRAVPGHVAGALAKALEKLPADRFESADAFQKALGDEGFTYAAPAGATSASSGPRGGAPAPARRDPRVVTLAAFAALATVAAAWGWLSHAEPPPMQPATRALIDLGDIQLLGIDEVVISPDGSRFAVTGTLDGKRGLFVRNADEENFRTLLDMGGPSYPEFSPDGDWIVYYNNSDNSLMKIALSGGTPQTVVPSSSDLDPTMPHWGDKGTIVFLVRGKGVYRVPDTGGEATLVASGRFWHPRLLPGGRGLLLTDAQSSSTRYVDLTADTVVDVITDGVDARYVDTGHLLYVDLAGDLWAVPFDLGQGATTGDAVPVLDGITLFGLFARYAVSKNGTLVYGHGGGGRELLVVTLSGEETVLGPGNFRNLRWSPDGESVAYAQRVQQASSGRSIHSIHIYNVELRTSPRRLTFGENDLSPVWSPDGEHIAFARGRDGSDDGSDLFVKAVHDDAPPQMIMRRAGQETPSHWIDGANLLFWSGEANTDLWTMQVSDSTSAATYLTSTGNLQQFFLSPQGDFAVYASVESGTSEVYVRSYPVPRQQVIVSQGAGSSPRWSPDGDKIYYWKANTPGVPDSLFAASVQHDPSFAVLSTQFVLSGEYILSSWDLHPDGDRFILTRDAAAAEDDNDEDGSEPQRYMVVTNWFEELKAKMGN